MIETVTDLSDLRERIADWKRAGKRIGFVPTMGNLHAGHHALVQLARQHADRVVTSIFVNPTQFGPSEDFSRYPRTPQADAAGLETVGCDLLWLPSVPTMYPHGADASVRIRVPGVADTLEGAHRPGHFDGVATVVARLFNQVQPDVAVFGRKDYQQLAVIGYLVRDLAIPLQLVAAETLREADGLAMSSRNQYLTEAERAVAPEIYRCLQWMRAAMQEGGAAFEDVEARAAQRLQAAGFVPDYAAVRREDLTLPSALDPDGALVALIAARLGRTRLIDNLQFSR